MSYSMSPPAQKPPPFSPQYQAGSPPAQSPYGAPPPKRQRLSPDPRSPPNGTPTYGFPPPYAYGPQSVQSPYSPSSYAGSPQGSFHTPQPYPHHQLPYSPQAQTPQQRPSQISPPPPSSSRDMPPPPRPVKEDKDNVEDIGDMLSGSGINLKEEENYLHGMWNNRLGAGDSFGTNQSTSFGSSTMSPNNSFNHLTQGMSFGSSGPDGAFAGTQGRPQTQEEIEEEAKKKRAEAARKRAEREQHHLNNQFLLGNCLRKRMHDRAAESSVRLDVQGVYLRNPEPQLQAQVLMNGEKGDGLVEIKPESKIEAGVPYEHILSLISLAAGERLRGLVDEAYGIARARQYGDHGRVVPPEFADIAEGEGKKSQESVVPENVTGTSWDRTQDSATMANGDSQVNGDKDTPQPVQTVSYQGTLNARLRELADRDRKAEKERAKKREARKKKAAAEGGDESTPAETPTETPATAAPVEAAAPVKMSKKEMNKKNKEAQSQEVHAFNQSNQTAAMMGNKKLNRYSWMSGGAAKMPTNRFAKPATGSGTATPKAQEDPTSSVVAKKEEAKVPTWGDWREVEAKDIELRDWAWVLQRDGKERKSLQRALSKLR